MSPTTLTPAIKASTLFVVTALSLLIGSAAVGQSSTPAATSTNLTASAETVSRGTAVSLTANVTASGTPVGAGLITFCNATAAYCEGPAIIGYAQLSAAGTGTLKRVLGPGTHSIMAKFVGTHAGLPSTSPAVSISVSGAAPTTTVAASSGSAGNYTLTATVGYHGLDNPAGSEMVSFVDTSNANYALGSAAISGLSAPAYDFITIPTSPVTVGNLPTSVVTDDFNGDGIPDFAVANLTDNTVSVFLGDGTGAFQQMSGSPFAVGAGPAALVVIDINADGLPDLVSANSVANNITVLLANSSGSFTVGPNIAVGNGPHSIALGDFNGDGLGDLAVANLYDSTITVLTNNGAGSFTSDSTSVYAVGQNPAWIGTADFNQDGILDLAIVNTTSNSITVLQGDGLGGFTQIPGSPIATVTYPVSAAIGDFNADGKPDLAVISGTGNTVSILLNTGTGFAGTGMTYPAGTSPSSVVVSDFDGDNQQDLVIANRNDNSATVLNGDGTGAFVKQSTLTNLRSPASVAFADFDGDGTEDLAITNLGGGSTSIRPLQITQAATATLSSIIVPGAATAHLVAAKYAGDSLYTASTSPTVSLTGSPIPTTDTFSISPATSVEFGQALQLTATISPPEASNYTASGAVTFYDGAASIGQSHLANGQALLSFNSLSVAGHTLSAKYAGDANFVASNSSAVALAVGKAVTAITLTATSGSGTSFTYTATVASATGATPQGMVTFFDGTSSLGSFPLVNGVANYSISSLSAGVHTIMANYSGDTDYIASTTTASVSTGDFALASAQTSDTVLPGKTVAYQLSITPDKDFPNAISFSVTGLPSGASASFSPATVTPGTAAATTTMSVSVPAQTASLQESAATSGIAFALLLLPFVTLRGQRRLRLLSIAMVLLGSLAGIATLTGCGGSGYLGQASQNYTLTITASSGTLVHTTSVTLNVQ